MATLSSGDITVNVEPFGPTNADVEQVRSAITRDTQYRAMAGDGDVRVLAITFPDAGDGRRHARTTPGFRATAYDYTNQRTIVIDGTLANPSRWAFTELASQPAPTEEEFAAAVERLHADAEVGGGLRDGRLLATRPMPPVLTEELEDGRTHRFIGVQLLADGGRKAAEILGVDPSSGQLLRFPERAPHRSSPGTASTCGAPTGAGQPTANQGTPGQVSVTIKDRNRTIWTFLAARPAASSGIDGSGIELRSVNYRGRRMLGRANVPILNVKYHQDLCGPYRDWQWQEGQIRATGTDVGTTGFRLCPTPAKTIVDTGSDTGNFLGTGIYIAGTEVVFVSELQAGWYRYVSEWRFDVRGTLKPRFTFAAVENPCVCNVHYHHVYWRFNFDIMGPGGNRVQEYNDPPVSGTSNWSTRLFESRRARNPARKRRWKVTNIASGAGVEIDPGLEDGVANTLPDAPFGRGDVWILQNRSTELDDGIGGSEARIDQWLNGERVDGRNVVIWYAGHFAHDLSHDEPALHGHVLGPNIKPVNWPGTTTS